MSYQDLKECKIITAFITPFHEDGSINFDAIPALIEHLLVASYRRNSPCRDHC